MRIVDSFGTEPEFNHPSYANRKKKKSEWGKLNFFPKQFNTMFRMLYLNILLSKPGFLNLGGAPFVIMSLSE